MRIFNKKKPNAKTLKAIKQAKKFKNLIFCKDANDLFFKLGI